MHSPVVSLPFLSQNRVKSREEKSSGYKSEEEQEVQEVTTGCRYHQVACLRNTNGQDSKDIVFLSLTAISPYNIILENNGRKC